MRRVLFVLMFLSFASVALGEEAQAPTKGPSLKLPTIVFAGAATADWVTTYRNMDYNCPTCGESNPLLNWVGQKPKTTIAMGAAMDVAGVWAWNKYVGKKHKKIAAAGLYVMAAFRVFLAVRNARHLNKEIDHWGPMKWR